MFVVRVLLQSWKPVYASQVAIVNRIAVSCMPLLLLLSESMKLTAFVNRTNIVVSLAGALLQLRGTSQSAETCMREG